MPQLDVFISSKMQELTAERQALYELIPTLSQGLITLFPWVFENPGGAPASDESIRKVYLDALQSSALYIGLFWNDYGEYTIDEFDRATEWHIPRHIYVKDVEANKRDPRLRDFLEKHGDVKTGITAKWFKTLDELKAAVTQSLGAWVEQQLRRSGGIAATLLTDPDVQEAPKKLIGRDAKMTEIRGYLDAGERVLLHGLGGTGKTALAATVISRWIADGKQPVIWLKAGNSDAATLFEALAQPFNAQQVIASAPNDDQKAEEIRKLLRASGASLLALDDAWNGRALNTILDKAVPRDLPVLITARQRHPIEGEPVEIPDLTPDAALELLIYHAHEDYTDDEKAAALCAKLGNLAFAVEIAGRLLRIRRRTPAELLAEIADAPQDMKLPLEFAEEGRESFANLLAASLNALPDEVHNTFLAFGALFSGTATPQLLMMYFVGTPKVSNKQLKRIRATNPHIRDMPDDDLRGLVQAQILQSTTTDLTPIKEFLTTLEDHGLAERIAATDNSAAYYRIHDLAHAYARAQNTDEHRDRALAACLAYTGRYNQPSLANFAVLRPELDNFMGAAEWAYTRARWAEVERFAESLFIGPSAGGGFLSYQGFYTQALTLLGQAAEAAKHQGNKRNQSYHLGNLGLAHHLLGQYQQAIVYYNQVLSIALESRDRYSQGNALGNLGIVYKDLGQYEEAIEYYQQALAIAQEIGDRRSEGYSRSNLGIAYKDLGQYEEAIEHYQQALVISREIGDRRSEGSQLGNLGTAYKDLGQYQEAIEHYQQALAIQREIGDKRGQGNQLGNLGIIYKDLGQYEEAIEHYQQALAIQREISDREGKANNLNNIGTLYHTQGGYEKAIDFYEQARAIFIDTGQAHRVALVEENIARARAAMSGGGAADDQ